MDGAANDLRMLRYVAEITRRLAKMLSRTIEHRHSLIPTTASYRKFVLVDRR